MPAFEPSPDLPTLAEIARALVDRPRAFSDCKEIPGARVYTQADNPESRDGNHTFILKSDDFTQVIVDAVTWIYQDLDITPRVRSAGPAREQQEVAHVLSQAGYKILPASRKIRHFVRPESLILPGLEGLDIRPLETREPGLEAVFAGQPEVAGCLGAALRRNQSTDTGPGKGSGISPILPAGGSRALPGLANPLPPTSSSQASVSRVRAEPAFPTHPALRLFGAWKDGRLVCVASLTFSRGLYCLDHVRTASGEEGKGYCQALLAILLSDPAISPPGRQITATDNPALIHIYRKLGFQALEDANPFWEAVLEGTHRSREPEELDEGDDDDEDQESADRSKHPAGGQSRNAGSGRPASGQTGTGKSGTGKTGNQAGPTQGNAPRPGAGRGKAARSSAGNSPHGTRKPGSGGRRKNP